MFVWNTRADCTEEGGMSGQRSRLRKGAGLVMPGGIETEAAWESFSDQHGAEGGGACALVRLWRDRHGGAWLAGKSPADVCRSVVRQSMGVDAKLLGT